LSRPLRRLARTAREFHALRIGETGGRLKRTAVRSNPQASRHCSAESREDGRRVGAANSARSSVRRIDEVQSPFDPRDPAIEIVEPHRQIGKVHLDFGNSQVERSDFELDCAESADDLIQFFALGRLLAADCSQHVQDRIGPLVAHGSFPETAAPGAVG
jgi:hypothetical protein